nr:molybdopterin-binding protein [uncultured Acetobacter sp.]
MKISARNQITGKIVAIQPGATTSHISLELPGGTVMMAAITNEAVADLDLKIGQQATALIKASDVMIGVE